MKRWSVVVVVLASVGVVGQRPARASTVLEYVRQTQKIPGGGVGSLIVACPGGMVPFGGGVKGEADAFDVAVSVPKSDRTAWWSIVNNRSKHTRSVTGYATCVTDAVASTLKTGGGPTTPHGQTAFYQTCDTGQHPIAGGNPYGGPVNEALLASSGLYPDSDTWATWTTNTSSVPYVGGTSLVCSALPIALHPRSLLNVPDGRTTHLTVRCERGEDVLAGSIVISGSNLDTVVRGSSPSLKKGKPPGWRFALNPGASSQNVDAIAICTRDLPVPVI